MAFLEGMNISASALSSQRTKMDIIADNIANTDTVKYKRKYVVFEQKPGSFQTVLSDRPEHCKLGRRTDISYR